MAGNSQTLTTRLVVDDDASKPTEAFAKKLEGLDKETATVVLALKAAGVQQDLAELLAEISKLDASDPTISVKVEQAAQAKSDLDDLTAKIQEINGQPVDIDTKPSRQNLDDLGKSADSSKSVLANMVGNTTQDLGALGGVAGSAGVAIGQMGEYMADAFGSGDKLGNVLKNFGKVAAPIAAVSAAMAVISEAMEGAAQLKAFNVELVKKYNKELDHTASTAEVLLESLTETGQIDFSAGGGGMFGFARDTEDVLELLQRVGLSVEDFQRLVATGASTETIYDLVHTQLGASIEDFSKLKDAVDQYAAANDKANTSSGVIKDTLDSLEGQVSETDRETRRLAGAMGNELKPDTDHAKTSVEELDAAVKNLYGRISRRESFLDAHDAISDYITMVAEGTGTTQDFERATYDAKTAVGDYVLALDDIDEEVKTRLITDIDQGSVQHATAVLDALEVARTTKLFIEPHLKGGKGIFTQTPDGEIVQKSAPPSVQTINVNLPRGSRSSDISRAMSAHTRRSGRRYGSPVVTRAR